MLRALSLVLALLVLPLGSASADAPPDPGANAALKYWQAFATLPKSTDAEQTKLIAECLTMPLDAQARQLVARAEYAFRMLHQGAALPRCDWGLGWEEEGVELLIPQGGPARVLSALACLRARMRFEAGQNAEALDDLVAAMTMGRHLSREGINIMVLLGYGIEHRTSEALARYLPRLNAGMLKDLKKRLDALPPGGSPATSLRIEEKCALDWLIRKAKGAKDKDSLLALLREFGESPEKNRAILEQCGGTADGVVKFAEATRPSYRRMTQQLHLPLAQFMDEWEREKSKQAGNPVFALVFPAYDRMRWQQERAAIRHALLAAAVAIQLDGPDALKQYPDPASGGPFGFAAFAGGFELRSKLQVDEKLRAQLRLDERSVQPLALTVGLRGR
jgi:hypothetical protein